MPVKRVVTPEQALAFARKRKVVPFTDVDGAGPSFVRAVVGGPARGSWWGHPLGKRIHELACGLDDSGEILTVKLLGGKETLVHKALWPALARVVTDLAWRRDQHRGLSAVAIRLLRAVDREGELRLDRFAERGSLASKLDRRTLAKARSELERRLLVRGYGLHTEKGSHTAVLAPWSGWVSIGLRRAASKLTLEEALEILRSACGPARSVLGTASPTSRGPS